MGSEQEGSLPKVTDEKVAELGWEPRNPWGLGPLHCPFPCSQPLNTPYSVNRGQQALGAGSSGRVQVGLRARSFGSPGAHHRRLQRPPTGKSLNGVRFVAFVVGKRRGRNARKRGQCLLTPPVRLSQQCSPASQVSGIRRHAGISPHGLAWAAMSTEG